MQNPFIPVNVVAVLEEPVNQNPVVILHDYENNKILPIWVGYPESRAIALALNNVVTSRPLTHNLLLNSIESLGARVNRVIIDKLVKHTYYSTIYLTNKDQLFTLDARPSDAIAIGIYAKVPIFVAAEVIQKAGQENPFSIATPQFTLTKNDLINLEIMISEARKREQNA